METTHGRAGGEKLETNGDMKRDDDFMRSILLEIEASDECHFVVDRAIAKTPERKKRAYHLEILRDKGFVVFQGDLFRLTSSGHDFIDAVRDDNIWKRTMMAIAEGGGSATIEIVKALATGFLKERISKHTGIEL